MHMVIAIMYVVCAYNMEKVIKMESICIHDNLIKLRVQFERAQ